MPHNTILEVMPSVSLVFLLATTAITTTHAKVTVGVWQNQTYQEFDGLGISQAFQSAHQVYGSDGLSQENADFVLNLLFSNRTGAGLTILRNGIGSSTHGDNSHMKSIAPYPPGTIIGTRDGGQAEKYPNAPPNDAPLIGTIPITRWNESTVGYDWHGDDNGQIHLTRDAITKGVRTVYANAWSAPAWMKSNLRDFSGGYLCGIDGVDRCAQGDMRRVYAEYLVKYLSFWENEGIPIDYLGFVNEPDTNTTRHASMLSTGGQISPFINILHSALRAANLTTKIACCDGAGWEQSREQLLGVQHAGAENLIGLATSHGYLTPPSTPLSTSHRVWQTEWADLDGPSTFAWWNNHSAGEGLNWALRIQESFTKSNVSAFLGWLGAGNDTNSNSALIVLRKNDVIVSKRLWAFAQFSRFVRKGAVRLHAKVIPSPPNQNQYQPAWPGVRVSAFRNPDGGIAVQVINNSTEDDCVQINGVSTRGKILRRYLTNEEHDLSKMSINTAGKGEECVGDVVGALPAKSMVSFTVEVLRPFGSFGGPPPRPPPAVYQIERLSKILAPDRLKKRYWGEPKGP